ncbi:MAG: phosphate ABC transporter substrate-binding protein, partial [Oscillospiraceae bacterium]|nr:phosphate ABC transporter substrate-binding protein [Oscillospiraceae bacterium]
MISKRRFTNTILLLLILSVLTSCVRSNTGKTVIVAGSTSVQPYAEILSERYKAILPDVHVEIQGGGSSAGITAAMSSAADIGMSSRALKESEDGLWYIEIAKDGLAMVVHPDNPISNLKLKEIEMIYSGIITNWSDVGGNDANIHIITREEGSGTRSAFEELVMDGVDINPKAIVQDSNGAVRQLVSSDKNAIGYISLGLVDE